MAIFGVVFFFAGIAGLFSKEKEAENVPASAFAGMSLFGALLVIAGVPDLIS